MTLKVYRLHGVWHSLNIFCTAEAGGFHFYFPRARPRQNPKSRKAKELARNVKRIAADSIRVKLRIAL
jgi:uncharacterized Zn finger protein